MQSQVKRLQQEMETAESEVTFKLAEVAEARGYEVANAENGEQVSQSLGQDQAPRLAILDTTMSDGDCISLCRK